MSEVASGVLEVGTTGNGEVVINHPDLKPDENGVGHIVFSPEQARNLGRLLLKKAEDAETEHATLYQAAAVSRVRGVVMDGTFPRRLGPAPLHAHEVTVKIGGDDWAYVLRTMRELSSHMEARGPARCRMCSGGAGGCHNVYVASREIEPEDYSRELMKWAGYE